MNPDDVRRGLVLHLDPDILEREGAASNRHSQTRVRGLHWFVCLLVDRGDSIWTPLFSRPSSQRIEIPKAAKRGAFKWRSSTTYADPKQMWACSTAHILLAAETTDRSMEQCFQNVVDATALGKQLNSAAIVMMRSYLRRQDDSDERND